MPTSVLPNPCHYQDYDRSMLYPAQSGSEGCSPKMCADEEMPKKKDRFVRSTNKPIYGLRRPHHVVAQPPKPWTLHQGRTRWRTISTSPRRTC
jgi:hypothetical protein